MIDQPETRMRECEKADLKDRLIEAMNERNLLQLRLAQMREQIEKLVKELRAEAASGLRQSLVLRSQLAYESAVYERGKADARSFAADRLQSLLDRRQTGES